VEKELKNFTEKSYEKLKNAKNADENSMFVLMMQIKMLLPIGSLNIKKKLFQHLSM